MPHRPLHRHGNFIVNLLGRVHRAEPGAAAGFYRRRLFANEVMLLPYYMAMLNIEHAYDLTRLYAVRGLCFVGYADLAEGRR
ncbi:MAG: hypothetical protein IPK19_21495 [Chloroflexi bacterium]|nr:hypothetical protein [Chloroflexota bacterium]